MSSKDGQTLAYRLGVLRCRRLPLANPIRQVSPILQGDVAAFGLPSIPRIHFLSQVVSLYASEWADA